MFESFNPKEERMYLAAEAFVKFANPYNEKWFCCNESDCKKVIVNIKKKHQRKYKSGKIVYVASHFTQNKKNEWKCSHTGETDRHYNLKMQIISLIYEKDLKIKIGNLILEYDETNIIGVEKLRISNRADVLLEFQKFNPILGNGLVIEIINTESTDSIEKKEIAWSSAGYSLAWVDAKTDFEGNTPTFDTININAPYLSTLHNSFEKLNTKISDRLREIEKWEQEILYNYFVKYKKELEFNKDKILEELHLKKIKTCRTCGYGSKSKDDEILISCFYKFHHSLQKFPDSREKEDHCENWSPDKHWGRKK